MLLFDSSVTFHLTGQLLIFFSFEQLANCGILCEYKSNTKKPECNEQVLKGDEMRNIASSQNFRKGLLFPYLEVKFQSI